MPDLPRRLDLLDDLSNLEGARVLLKTRHSSVLKEGHIEEVSGSELYAKISWDSGGSTWEEANQYQLAEVLEPAE